MLDATKRRSYHQTSSIFVFTIASFASSAWAVFPNVESMLVAARPTFNCPNGSEFCTLYANLDALAPYPAQYSAALQTIVPIVDGSLRAASDGAMWEIVQSINGRLMRVNQKEKYTGYSAGDTLKPMPEAQVQIKNTTPIPLKVKGEASETVTIEENTSSTALDEQLKLKKETKKETKVEVEEKNNGKKEVKTEEVKIVKDGVTVSSESNNGATKTKETEISIEKDKTNGSTKTEIEIKKEETKTDSSDTKASVKSAEDDKAYEKKIKDKGVWLQILGSNIGQDTVAWVPGYDADVLGLVIGRDFLFTPCYTAGLAIGYQHARVDSRGPSGSFMGIKRFQGSFYAGYHFICPFYINTVLTAARNDYKINRKLLVVDIIDSDPIVNIAYSDFAAWELDGYLETGYIWQCGNFRAIPKMMVNYSHFGFSSYLEQDAFDLDMHIRYNDINSLPLGGGLKIDYVNHFNNVNVVPELHAYLFYDFQNNVQTATAWMLGGGYTFITEGVIPAHTSYEVGASLNVYSYQNVGINFQYDYAARSHYHRNSAFIKIRYEWA